MGGLRVCDHPSCREEGQYRAPRSRFMSEEHYWFCIGHVREYNASWDFCSGMDEEAIEAHVRGDTTWWRPTWRLGSGESRVYPHGGQFTDPFGVAGNAAASRHQNARTAPTRPPPATERALRIMRLDWPVTLDAVKSRYKELAKRHHPDLNGGDRLAEERLKLINQAYNTLRKALS